MDNKQRIQMYLKRLWEQRDLSVIDEIFLPDVIIHSPFTIRYGGMTMREIVARWLDAFPDLLLFWRDTIAEGDTVVSRWRAKGTHLGGFFETSPTHHEVSYVGVTIHRLKEGMISEYWALVDVHAILKQLGCYQSISEVIE